MDERADRRAKARVWAPVATGVAVLALVAGVVAIAPGDGDDGSGDRPPPLRLSTAGAATESSAASSDTTASTMLAWGGDLRLEGELPADGPDEGRVHRLPAGAADADAVRRLAAALGLTGEPSREGDIWRAGDEHGSLEVMDSPGRQWWFGPVIQPRSTEPATSPADSPVADPATSPVPVPPEPCPEGSDACTTPGAGGGSDSVDSVQVVPEPAPYPDPLADPIGETEALAIAEPVLEAIGRADLAVRSEAYSSVRSVVADPRVEGLPTSGWSTRLEIGPDGALLSAGGWLGPAEPGDAYPLIGAQAAFDLLAAQPQPEIAMLCAPEQPCGPAERVVTGAVPGLQLVPDADGMLLVPAWLFSLRDLPEPLAQVSVEPGYLAPPDLPDPDTPTQVAPVPPDPGDDGGPAGRAAFGFDRAARGVQDNEVVVGYGDSSSCPHTNVVPLVKEEDDAVHVTLEADAQPPDRACTADYVGVDLVVPLERPLGKRVVVDATSGQRYELAPAG